MIEVHQLAKRFTQGRGRAARTVLAVDGVTWAAANGSITGLLGPNGAGKTTTLRMVTTSFCHPRIHCGDPSFNQRAC